MKNKFGSVYFSIFGLIVLGLGIAELIIGIAGRSFTWSILEISGGLLLWKGIILFFAGFF
ncbi:unnamed protein product, partial [marine sediment metagenome]